MDVGVLVAVGVPVAVDVGVGVLVGVFVIVGVAAMLGVGVLVAVAVSVTVLVGVNVAAGVGVVVAIGTGTRLGISPAANWRMSATSNGLITPLPSTSAPPAHGREDTRPAWYCRMNIASTAFVRLSQFTSPIAAASPSLLTSAMVRTNVTERVAMRDFKTCPVVAE